MALTGCEEQGLAVAVRTKGVETVELFAGVDTATSAKAGTAANSSAKRAQGRVFIDSCPIAISEGTHVGLQDLRLA